jgi:hypothetical protein
MIKKYLVSYLFKARYCLNIHILLLFWKRNSKNCAISFFPYLTVLNVFFFAVIITAKNKTFFNLFISFFRHDLVKLFISEIMFQKINRVEDRFLICKFVLGWNISKGIKLCSMYIDERFLPWYEISYPGKGPTHCSECDKYFDLSWCKVLSSDVRKIKEFNLFNCIEFIFQFPTVNAYNQAVKPSKCL